MDGKAIKVEQANKPSFESGGRRRRRLHLKNRGHPRSLKCRRAESGGERRRPSRGGHLGNVLKYKDATIRLKNSKPDCIEISQLLFTFFMNKVN